MYKVGHIPWNTGKTLSAEHRAKMSAALMGNQRRLGIPHTAEARAKMSAVLNTPEVQAKLSLVKKGNQNTLGKIWSLEVRGRMAEAAGRRVERSFDRSPTSLERALEILLQDAGLEYEAQKRFGRYVVDFYVPSHNLAFEADGQFWYWHQDKEREARRDSYLVEYGVAAVIHLDDGDLKPWEVGI